MTFSPRFSPRGWRPESPERRRTDAGSARPRPLPTAASARSRAPSPRPASALPNQTLGPALMLNTRVPSSWTDTLFTRSRSSGDMAPRALAAPPDRARRRRWTGPRGARSPEARAESGAGAGGAPPRASCRPPRAGSPAGPSLATATGVRSTTEIRTVTGSTTWTRPRRPTRGRAVVLPPLPRRATGVRRPRDAGDRQDLRCGTGARRPTTSIRRAWNQRGPRHRDPRDDHHQSDRDGDHASGTTGIRRRVRSARRTVRLPHQLHLGLQTNVEHALDTILDEADEIGDVRRRARPRRRR